MIDKLKLELEIVEIVVKNDNDVLEVYVVKELDVLDILFS